MAMDVGQQVKYRDKKGHVWPAIIVGIKTQMHPQTVDLRVLGISDRVELFENVDRGQADDEIKGIWF